MWVEHYVTIAIKVSIQIVLRTEALQFVWSLWFCSALASPWVCWQELRGAARAGQLPPLPTLPGPSCAACEHQELCLPLGRAADTFSHLRAGKGEML